MGLKSEASSSSSFPSSSGLALLLDGASASDTACPTGLNMFSAAPLAARSSATSEHVNLVAAASQVLDLSHVERAVLSPGESFFPSLAGVLKSRLQDVSSTASSAGLSPSSSSGPGAGSTQQSNASGTSADAEGSGGASSAPGTSAAAPRGATPSGDARMGRLGPGTVEVDASSWVGRLALGADGLSVESLVNFSSFRASACVFAGKWQYEATVLTPGIQQIGWATLSCPFTPEEGVGDAHDSYAYDGKRVKKWNVKPLSYGQAWASGDVIGSCLDLEAGELTFYRNGVSMGVAFTGIKTMQPTHAYFPAVSLSYAERCELNFGAQPLRYPQPGYEPLQAPPPAPASACACYLVSCLERLVTATYVDSGSRSMDGGAGGAAAVAASGAQDVPADASSRRTLETAMPASPCTAAAAAAAAVAAATAASAAGTSALGSGKAVLQPRFRLAWDDQLLLGGMLVDALLPHLLDPYLVSSALLPVLLGLATSSQPGSSAALSSLLQLLELTLDQEVLSGLVTTLLEALARRCVSAPLIPEQFPYSGAHPYLCLACAIAARPELRALWLRTSGLWGTLEGLLTRKSPGQDDLKLLIPQVWWRSCPEPSDSKERMQGALQALSSAITRVEDKQYELMVLLLGGLQAAPSAGGGGSGGGAAACARSPQEEPVLDFLSFLLHKNRGAMRDLPPPSLSDPTVLISAFYVLVRLLRVALPLLESFPAAALFVKTAIKGELEPVNDLPRLGGIVTHLCREAPVPAADQGELALTQPIGPGGSGTGALPAGQLLPNDVDALLLSKLARNTRLVPELLNVAMTLYAFRVNTSVRLAHSLSQTLCNSLVGLEEVERHLARATAAAGGGSGTSGGGVAGAGSGLSQGGSGGASMPPSSSGAATSYLSYLRQARDFFQSDIAGNIRFSSLLKVVFFSGWKQDASLAVASWLSRMLLAAHARGNLLGYVPTCYVDYVLDTMASLRHAQEHIAVAALPPAGAAPSAAHMASACGLHDTLAMLSSLLHDVRICNPDVKESIVSVVSAMLEQRELLTAFEANEVARQRLVPMAVACFDSRLWHPVSGLLLRLVRGQGFAEPPPGERKGSGGGGSMRIAAAAGGSGGGGGAGAGTSGGGSAGPLGATRGASTGGAGAGVAPWMSCGSPVFRSLLVQNLQPEGPALPGFLTRLFNMLNWATTEFAVCVSELVDPRSRRHVAETQQQYRKAGIMFDLVAGLLRILEFVATHMPQVFLEAGSTLNLDRLLETVWFVLSHFTEGADARRLDELLTLPPVDRPVAVTLPAGSSSGSTVRMERSMLADKVTKPLVLAPVVGTLIGLWQANGEQVGARRGVLLDGLARHWDARTEQQLAFLRALDWRAALPSAMDLEPGLRLFVALCGALEERRRQAGAGGIVGAGSISEVPEELLDPITMTLMSDPVVLPDSQVTVDRATIQRHMLTSATDPFSRSPITMEQLKPNEELKAKIEEWLKRGSRPQ